MTTFRNAGALIPNDRIEPLVLSDRELSRYSVLRATEAARTGDWFEAGLEREIGTELRRRARLPDLDPRTLVVPPQILARDLTLANASGGGYLGDSPVYGVVDALRETSVVFRAGAQRLTGLRSNGTYATQGSRSTVTWAPTESTQAAETASYTFGSIAIAQKTVTAYVEESRQLRLMSPELGEMTIRRELRSTLSTALDAAALQGSGVNGEPTGILNAGIGTFTGASVAYSGLLEAQTDILTANSLNDGSAVSFVCRPAVASLLAARQGFSTNAPMWTGPLWKGQVAGCDAFSTMNIPATTLLAGDFSQLLIAEFGSGLEIRVNPYANFQAGIVGYGASLNVDVCTLRASGFSVATSVT